MKVVHMLLALVGGFFLAFGALAPPAAAKTEKEVMQCVDTALDHKPFSGTKAQRLAQARRLQPNVDLFINGSWTDLPKGSNPYRLCGGGSSAEQLAAANKEIDRLKALVYDPATGKTWQEVATGLRAQLATVTADTYLTVGEGNNQKQVKYKDLVSGQQVRLDRARQFDYVQWSLIVLALLIIGLLAWTLVRNRGAAAKHNTELRDRNNLINTLRNDSPAAQDVLRRLRNQESVEHIARSRNGQSYARPAEPPSEAETDEPLFGDDHRRPPPDQDQR